jgi:hypothetical protein
MLHNDAMDAEIRARIAWENRQRQICDAWRHPPSLRPQSKSLAPQTFTVDAAIIDARERAEVAREKRHEMICNAWRLSK